jgi:hypothetical protein
MHILKVLKIVSKHIMQRWEEALAASVSSSLIVKQCKMQTPSEFLTIALLTFRGRRNSGNIIYVIYKNKIKN